MTQAKLRFASFEEYFIWSNDHPDDIRYELVDGELIELAPGSEETNWFAANLRDALIRVISRRLVKTHGCEVQVPVLQPKDAANRYPDLIVLRKEHIGLTRKRLTIKLDMPPPQLVAEVLSPGKTNRDRDLIRKRAQYAQRCIPEYWLIDPKYRTITVLVLESGQYAEFGVFQGSDRISSPTVSQLDATAEEIFADE